MNLLFLLPKCHLSIYIISHLLYHLPSLHIYVILPSHPYLSIHEYWSHLIKKYELEYIYQLSKTNLQHLHFIPFDQMKEMEEFLKKEMDSIFYIPSSQQNLQIQSFKNEWKFLFSLQKKIHTFISIDSIHLDFIKIFIQKIKKKSNRYIYYYGLYLGEDERGILQDHFMIHEFQKSISNSIQQKKWNESLNLLYLDDLHSLYEYVYQQLQKSHSNSFHESIFLNTKNPMIFPFQKDIQEIYQLPIYLEKWIQQYHKNIYELHERNDLHKIGYEKEISILQFFKNTISFHKTLKESSPNVTNTITQGILLLSFLIFLFICGIFLYFKIENKHYLFIFYDFTFDEITTSFTKILSRFYKYNSSYFRILFW